VDTDILQIRKVFARTPQNNFIPSSHILIANGNGETRWGPVSSILEISSFNTIQGNTPVYLNADLTFDTLKISTTGVDGLFQSYVDPVQKVLMLSNVLPPIAVSRGSIPTISRDFATIVPNAESLIPTTGFSTIKFLGVNDILLSTVTDQKAIFISISSFTSVGYSTISGETFAWRPTLYSTLSTSAGITSFISSVGFVGKGTTLNLSTVIADISNPYDLYFSSITFPANHLMRYIDNHTSNTRLFVEMYPNFFFPSITQTQDSNNNYLPLVKEVVSYIQLETLTSGRVVFNESSNVSYLTSQIMDSNSSNYFQTPIRMEINPYVLQSNININLLTNVNLTVYHKITAGLYFSGSNSGFVLPFLDQIKYDNQTNVKGGLYLQLVNSIQTLP
jgi:hypothetical protein